MTSSKNQETAVSRELEDGDFSTADLSRLTEGLTALRKANKKTLNDLELTSVRSLIAYVAYTQKVDEQTVSKVVTSHYGIKAVDALPARLYQDAIEYLVDLKMDKVVN